uniref:Uncharacterized protein n=1 Tax=Streptomyces sp. NBC_00003 TaxID=2903608 RepID=A0AAU2V0B4_9ACTN
MSNCLEPVMQLIAEGGGFEGRSLVEIFFCRTDLDQAGQSSMAW